uniref:Single-pass membrane and coiled-coil domain-containing protein 4 n=2 Tax=Steinernema glaseri TaxID=37863 RepID=A0A1I8ALX1_9BILA
MRAHPFRIWSVSSALQMSRPEPIPESASTAEDTLPSYNEAITDTQKYPKEVIIVVPSSHVVTAQHLRESRLYLQQPPPSYDRKMYQVITIRTDGRLAVQVEAAACAQPSPPQRRRRRRLQMSDVKKLVAAPIILCIFTMIMIIVALYGVKKKDPS